MDIKLPLLTITAAPETRLFGKKQDGTGVWSLPRRSILRHPTGLPPDGKVA